jgi:hypothetical protein
MKRIKFFFHFYLKLRISLLQNLIYNSEDFQYLYDGLCNTVTVVSRLLISSLLFKTLLEAILSPTIYPMHLQIMNL